MGLHFGIGNIRMKLLLQRYFSAREPVSSLGIIELFKLLAICPGNIVITEGLA